MKFYDIVIVGGGISGFTAAKRAGERGASVALVEKERLGGQWLFNGRFVVRALIQQVAMLSSDLGLGESLGSRRIGGLDANQFLGEARNKARWFSDHWETILERKNIKLIRGTGRPAGSGSVVVESGNGEEVIRAGKVIIASGSKMKETPSMPFDGERVSSGDDLLRCNYLPEHLLLVGGQAEGCELATTLRWLGRKVFVCEEEDHILTGFDKDLTKMMEQELRRNKIKLILQKHVLSIRKQKKKIDISLDGGVRFSVDGIWVCKDRVPYIESFGDTDIRTGEHGEVLVNEEMQSSADGVFAIGSVTRRRRNSLLSQEEARVAVDNALGNQRMLNRNRIPHYIQTVSELVSVGCFAEDAHHRGFGRGVEGICNWKDISGLDSPLGLVKVVVDSSNRQVIGCHLMAPGAGSVLPLLISALRKKWVAADLIQFSYSLETLFQALGESARAASQLVKAGK